MTEKILDVKKWEKEYPFLDSVWNLYKKFDKPVNNEDIRSQNYENVCKQKVDDYDRLENSQKQFCMKLVRNLACYNYEDGYYNLNNEECMILYYWIYSSVKQHNINNNLITPIFYDNYSRFCTYERKANCFYNLYYDYFEDPVGMIFLDIFQQNINTVINMLGNTDVRINANLQKYICECINIYNEMNKTYCLSDVYNDEKRTWTCSRLAAVKLTYDAYLAGKLYKNYVIPVLGRNEGEYLEMCPQDSPGSKLTTEKHRTVSLPSLNEVRDVDKVVITLPGGFNSDTEYHLTSSTEVHVQNAAEPLYSKEVINEKPGDYMSHTVLTDLPTQVNEFHGTDSSGSSSTTKALDSVAHEDHSTGSSVRSSTTTALATVTAVSSALALLYKFSPLRNRLYFGLRGNRKGINNNWSGDEGNEILFDENIHSEYNSYNIGYDAA